MALIINPFLLGSGLWVFGEEYEEEQIVVISELQYSTWFPESGWLRINGTHWIGDNLDVSISGTIYCQAQVPGPPFSTIKPSSSQSWFDC